MNLRQFRILCFIIVLFIFVLVGCSGDQPEDNITNSSKSKHIDQVNTAIDTLPKEFELARKTITIEEQKQMLTYLASDELKGRYPGDKDHIKVTEFIKNEFKSYGLLPGGENGTYYQKFSFDIKDDHFTTNNVIGYLEGNHPDYKDEYIIIAAHYDHIGYGKYCSRSGYGEIHNGADDNASGTVAVLEIAEAFSKVKDKINQSIVFIMFSGEELGLKGSKHYINNPTFPLECTSFMLNLDMVGRLNDKKQVVSYDTYNDLIKTILNKVDDNYDFNIKYGYLNSASSDHYNFYQVNIPVSFLHTGLHNEYHTPLDDTDLIDFEGLQKITSFSFDVVSVLDNISYNRKTVLW